MYVFAVSFPRFWAAKGYASRSVEVYLTLNTKNNNHIISMGIAFLHSYNNILKRKLNTYANTSNKIYTMQNNIRSGTRSWHRKLVTVAHVPRLTDF